MKNEIHHLVIRLNSIPVMKVEEHMHPEVVLYSRLSFSALIKAAICEARKGIGLLRYPSNFLHRHTLHELFKRYVRLHLDFGNVIYYIRVKSCKFSVTLSPNLIEK